MTETNAAPGDGKLRIIAALGTSQTLAWASSYYLAAIIADPIARELGTGTITIFAAFSASLLVSALLGLGPEETQALVEEAERHIDKSHDLYQFTSQINRTFSEAEKVGLLEALWRVADADLTVHKYEEHLIRRVADLLHVRHSDFIAAKLRATAATNRD